MMDLQTIVTKNAIDPHSLLKSALNSGLLSDEEIIEAVEFDENIGFCLMCGADKDCDEILIARGDKCDHCGENAVYGAEELLLMLPAA